VPVFRSLDCPPKGRDEVARLIHPLRIGPQALGHHAEIAAKLGNGSRGRVGLGLWVIEEPPMPPLFRTTVRI
jgi:hypothetical protein